MNRIMAGVVCFLALGVMGIQGPHLADAKSASGGDSCDWTEGQLLCSASGCGTGNFSANSSGGTGMEKNGKEEVSHNCSACESMGEKDNLDSCGT